MFFIDYFLGTGSKELRGIFFDYSSLIKATTDRAGKSSALVLDGGQDASFKQTGVGISAVWPVAFKRPVLGSMRNVTTESDL